MASYHGPKAKVQRRFGEVLVPRAKYQKILEKRPYPPGEHGKEKQYRSGRRTEYGLQLNEKQKLAFIYNIREAQMRRYFMRARRLPGVTGENLLILLERRLDNLVYRAGFAATIWAARQLVKHGHILVDGQRVDLPSYQVKPGQTISVVEKMRKNPHVVEALEGTAFNLSYLQVDRDNLSAKLVNLPARDEIPTPIQEQLVVEFYTRLT
ncbi:MAG: 30S ribosomal protein S4 [Chloroflexota bacterium]|nr:MAG: 30S ribosomal protein S4 [Chloroflexota bacterium]